MNNQRWLFVCSCIALITSAFTFSVRGDILQDMGNAFGLSQEQKGGIEGAVFTGMALSMFFGGFICDYLGIKKIMWLAFLSHIGGSLATIYTPKFSSVDQSYSWLFWSSILMGCGNGFTEVGINPLVATLYPREKTHYLNILHAWWPGGLVIGGLSARVMGKGIDFINLPGQEYAWSTVLFLIVIPTILYGLMLIPARFPETERVQSGVSTGAMFGELVRPMFLIWAFCMLLTAATELGPQKWQESVMSNNAGMSGTLILVYTSAMMFILRHFAGPIAHRISPIGLLLVSSVLAAAGLYLLSFADTRFKAVGFATIFGLGIAYFWPTMLGVAAERFPKGGALVLALMGTAGNASIAFVLPQMGKIVDRYAVEYVQQKDPKLLDQVGVKSATGFSALDEKKAEELSKTSPEAKEILDGARRQGYSMAFRWVSLLPTLLIVLFGGIALYDRARGGYRPELILSKEEEDELFAGGVQAPVE